MRQYTTRVVSCRVHPSLSLTLTASDVSVPENTAERLVSEGRQHAVRLKVPEWSLGTAVY